MARRTTKRSAASRGIPAPVRVVKGPPGPAPKALRGKRPLVMTVADLVQRRWDAGKRTTESKDQWRGDFGRDINHDILLDHDLLLSRARHEGKNNPNVAGAKIIMGAHTVGRAGPTIQLRTADRKFAARLDAVLREFFENAGADGRHLVDHLLDAVRGIPDAGEILWQIVSEQKPTTVVGARIHPLNSKYLRTPPDRTESQTMRLGVERTKTNKPVRYWYQEVDDALGPTGRYIPIPAAEVLHWYRRDEPGQVRGVPHIAPSLTAASDLRAYEKAVQDAMESAALFGVILYSTDPKNRTIVLQGETEITPKTMAAIPPGYQAAQIAPQHPSQNHEAWKRSKLQQVLLPLGMPTVVGLMDSMDTSYSGGRIDLQNFGTVTAVNQAELERTLLDPLVRIAIREALLAGAIPKVPADFDWHWVWPAIPHVDPVKQALSQRMRMQDGTLDEAGAAADYGIDSATLRANRQREQIENDIRLIERVAAMQQAMAAAGLDPKEWPLLLAAAGALTAPGAYLQGAAAAQPAGGDAKTATTADAKANLEQDVQDQQDQADGQRSAHRGGRRRAA